MKKENKKNAFTLIELLAIIVILAIIAVITVPIILNIIENSKKGAATNSAYGYKDSVEKYYLARLFENTNEQYTTLNETYTISEGKLNTIDIPFEGTIPSSGSLTYENNILTEGCLTIGDYKVTFENGKVVSTEKGTCQTTTSNDTDDTDNNNTTPTETVETVEYTIYNTSTSQVETTGNFDSTWKYYIKSTTTNNETTTYELCGLNNSNQQFCLKPNEYSTTAQTVLTYLGCDSGSATVIQCSTDYVRWMAFQGNPGRLVAQDIYNYHSCIIDTSENTYSCS